jgi:hypothetical protein
MKKEKGIVYPLSQVNLNKELGEDMQPYINTIIQLCESLSCDAGEIEDVVNQLNMTEYWVLNHMLDLCEDNDVMRKVLKESFEEFIKDYDVEGVPFNE